MKNPNYPSLNSQCSIPAVKADIAWDYWNIPDEMPGDANVLLASVDTGMDYTHPDLLENIWVNQGEIPALIYEIGIDTNDDGVIRIIASPENFAVLNSDGAVTKLTFTVTGSDTLSFLQSSVFKD